MAGTQAEGASHVDLWRCPPESLKIVDNKTSAFYDERGEKPVAEWLVTSIIRHGFIEPVVVIRDGEEFVINDGRQRQRALIEANRRLEKAGKAPLPITYMLKRSADGEAGIIGMSAVLNLHVEDLPSMRARKAQRMLEFGATKDDIAADFGFKTSQSVDDLLALLDCSSAVQKAVDAGTISLVTARELKGLPRDQQKATLEGMIANGVAKGAPAKRAVREVKKGRQVPERGTAKKMRSRVVVEKLLDGLNAMDLDMETTRVVLPLLRWILGEPESEALLTTKVRQAVVEIQGKRQK